MSKMVTKILREAPSCQSRRHIGQSRQPQVRPGLQLCLECRNGLENNLIELPGWYESCEHTLDYYRYLVADRPNGHNPNGQSPNGQSPNGQSPNGQNPNGIRLSDAAIMVRSDMIGVLASWCRVVVDERGVTQPDVLDVRKLTGFLAVHLEWLTAHAAAPDLADEIVELAKAARDFVQPDSVVRIELGPCLQPGCGRTVHAMTRDEESLVPYRVSCEAGHVWRPDQWLVLSGRLAQARRALSKEQSPSAERLE